ncbi:PucR family transcriptional regulator [Lentzea sp. NPDC102401]|uniref:PucR family transcriptional regulator n=1 Tax=Lentzea sp. NPDC102401 TaxID=3364128 RepID=UPI003827B1E8
MSVPGRDAAIIARDAGSSWSEDGHAVQEVVRPLRLALIRLLGTCHPADEDAIDTVVGRVLQSFFIGFHERAAITSGTTFRATFADVTPVPACVSKWELVSAAGGRLLHLGTGRSGRLLVATGPADARRILAACFPPAADCWAGVAPSDWPGSPAGATDLAHRIAVVVRALGCPPGVYERGDVLLELLAVQDVDAARMLAPAMARVLNHQTLVATLKVLFHTNGNRNEAARRLSLHRSTLDYRLTRIAELTGWNPVSSRDLMMLRTGLAVVAVQEDLRKKKSPLDSHVLANGRNATKMSVEIDC